MNDLQKKERRRSESDMLVNGDSMLVTSPGGRSGANGGDQVTTPSASVKLRRRNKDLPGGE